MARGTTHSSSDVDMLADVTTDADGFAYFGVLEDLRRALERLLGCEVDIVELHGPFSPRGHQLAERIRREATPL